MYLYDKKITLQIHVGLKSGFSKDVRIECV